MSANGLVVNVGPGRQMLSEGIPEIAERKPVVTLTLTIFEELFQR